MPFIYAISFPIPHTIMVISLANYFYLKFSLLLIDSFLSCFQQLPLSLRIQHMSTDTQLAGAYDPLNLDGFVSPCRPHTVTQVQYINVFENIISFSFHLQKMEISFIKICFAIFIYCLFSFSLHGLVYFYSNS